MADATTSQNVSPGLLMVAKGAKEHPEVRMLALARHIDEAALERVYRRLRRDAAVGADGVTVEAYGEALGANLQALRARMKAGQYRHQPIRRAALFLRPPGVPARRLRRSCTRRRVRAETWSRPLLRP